MGISQVFSLVKRKLSSWLHYTLACAVGLGWLCLGAAGPAAAAQFQASAPAGRWSVGPASVFLPQTNAQALTADEFWQQVDASLAWLAGGPALDSPEWQAEAERWKAVGEVTLPGGQVVTIDSGRIVALLEADPPDREALSSYLSALKESRSLTTPPGGEREAQLLRDILARPEFKENADELNFLQKIYQWLLEQFWRLIDLLFGRRPGNVAIPSEITLTVTLLLIAAILVFVFRDTLRNLFAEVELTEESAGQGEILSARAASQKAQALSGSGDYRHALRYLYLSALLLLDERGLLRYNRAQTNREYLRQVRSRPELAGHLKEVVETFDRVWYGFQPIDEASYARYAEHVSALEETKE
jgi:hypothetical protein